jgi:hypothetical protein
MFELRKSCTARRHRSAACTGEKRGYMPAVVQKAANEFDTMDECLSAKGAIDQTLRLAYSDALPNLTRAPLRF